MTACAPPRGCPPSSRWIPAHLVAGLPGLDIKKKARSISETLRKAKIDPNLRPLWPVLVDGADVLGILRGDVAPRERLFGLYGAPGTPRFKVMVREGRWKYIFLANGGGGLLFDVAADPQELRQLLASQPDVAGRMRNAAAAYLAGPAGKEALDEDGGLRAWPFQARPLRRIYQFDRSRGIIGFPDDPATGLQQYHAERGS